MSDDPLVDEFKTLHAEWRDAIADKKFDWFERHFAEDFLGTAQPWPKLSVDKEGMIRLSSKIDRMDAHWVDLDVSRYGDTALIRGIVHYEKEEFRPGAEIGEGMPTGHDLSSYVNGKRVLYIGGWRHNGRDWQLFDHHMVGIIG